MAKPPHRALRVVLRVFSILIAVGSLVMIFSSKPKSLRGLGGCCSVSVEESDGHDGSH